jgi:formylglycine-generating enzyme required for sulfatase activity
MPVGGGGEASEAGSAPVADAAQEATTAVDPAPVAAPVPKPKPGPRFKASKKSLLLGVGVALLVLVGAGYQWGYRPWQAGKVAKQKAKEEAEKQAKLTADYAQALSRAKSELERLAAATEDYAALDALGSPAWLAMKAKTADGNKLGKEKPKEAVAAYNEALRLWPEALKEVRELWRKQRIGELLSTARDSGTREKAKAAIAACKELVQLDPENTEAAAIKKSLERLLSLQPGETITNSLGMILLWIKPGEFQMGSPSNEPERDLIELQHPVRLTRGFWLGNTEVTQGAWEALTGVGVAAQRDKMNKELPLRGEGKQYPIYYVTWEEAMDFCRRLTELERGEGRLPDGCVYTLPTEAQWEYACRAGTTTPYAGNIELLAWYSSNSNGSTQPVATKRPNPWGLFDMHGNVWEWCLDWYSEYAPGQAVDPRGPASGTSHVGRGGAWSYRASVCRSAVRLKLAANFRSNLVGFRVALAPAPAAP